MGLGQVLFNARSGRSVARKLHTRWCLWGAGCCPSRLVASQPSPASLRPTLGSP